MVAGSCIAGWGGAKQLHGGLISVAVLKLLEGDAGMAGDGRVVAEIGMGWRNT